MAMVLNGMEEKEGPGWGGEAMPQQVNDGWRTLQGSMTETTRDEGGVKRLV